MLVFARIAQMYTLIIWKKKKYCIYNMLNIHDSVK